MICPHCGGHSQRAFQTYDYNLRVSDEAFDYFSCSVCDLVFLQPVPANLADYYSSRYFVYTRPKTIDELEAFLRVQEDYKLGQVLAYRAAGRLIDIGAGYGGFALRAKRAGFEVEAVEMNPDACRFLSDVVGVRAHQTTDPAAALPALPGADVITLWHVIEHVPKPFELLAQAAQQLRPGGILVLASPNPQSFQFRLFRGRWKGVDAPRHLMLIPAPLIVSAMRVAGLQPLLVDSRDANSQLEDYTYWHEQFTSRFRQRSLQRLARLVSGAARSLLKPLERRSFGGSSYTLVFEKPRSAPP